MGSTARKMGSSCSAKAKGAEVSSSEKKLNDDLDRVEAQKSEICGRPTTLCLSLQSGATRDVIVGLDNSVGQLQRKMARELLKRVPEDTDTVVDNELEGQLAVEFAGNTLSSSTVWRSTGVCEGALVAMDESVMQSAYDKAWVIKLEAEAQRKRQELEAEAQKRLQNAGACTVGQSDGVDFTKILTDIFELMDKNADGYIDGDEGVLAGLAMGETKEAASKSWERMSRDIAGNINGDGLISLAKWLDFYGQSLVHAPLADVLPMLEGMKSTMLEHK